MKLSKNHIVLIFFNIICLTVMIGYSYTAIKVLTTLSNHSQILSNLLFNVLFLAPYVMFLIFSINIFKDRPFSKTKYKGFTAMQWIVFVSTIVCVIISALFIYYGAVGIASTLEGIVGIKEGYIVSEIYSQEQLLAHFTKTLYRNIFSVFASVVFLISYIWSAVSIFFKSKQ